MQPRSVAGRKAKGLHESILAAGVHLHSFVIAALRSVQVGVPFSAVFSLSRKLHLLLEERPFLYSTCSRLLGRARKTPILYLLPAA